jgi:hypothetical protein
VSKPERGWARQAPGAAPTCTTTKNEKKKKKKAGSLLARRRERYRARPHLGRVPAKVPRPAALQLVAAAVGAAARAAARQRRLAANVAQVAKNNQRRVTKVRRKGDEPRNGGLHAVR